MLQLPIYIPSDEEKSDTLLYAKNVRQYMVWPPFWFQGFACLLNMLPMVCMLKIVKAHMLQSLLIFSCLLMLQLSFSDCVPLKPSDAKLADKRAYHDMVRRQSTEEKKSGIPSPRVPAVSKKLR